MPWPREWLRGEYFADGETSIWHRRFRRRCRMSPRAPRKPRSVKVEDALWEAAKRKADERGEILSEVIREALKRYVNDS